MTISKRNTLILIFVLAGLKVFAQVDYFANPVKIPIFLSGNFCELRPNHFHGGIDFKTQQRIGIPIYSAAEGFIYRIVVSPTGYGKAIYIEHPNGTSSVYAHLDRFREDIEEYVSEVQYRRKSFAVDLTPEKNQFQFEKQEFIAFGGNSGSSGGPHLHFEIRDSKTQDALNPLAYNFTVTDNVPPRIYSLVAYPIAENSHINSATSKRSFQAVSSGTNYTLPQNAEIQAFGKIGFAIRANDFYDGSHNICGIYSAQMKVNGEEIFAYAFDRMPFSDTRYMNSHIDYELSLSNGNRIHKLWRQPGNKLKIYQTDVNRGIIDVKDGESYTIEITVSDIAGNTASLNYQVKGVARDISRPVPEHVSFFTYDDDNLFRTPFFEILAQEGAFYDDFYFQYQVSQSTPDLFSKIHRVHRETEPIHLPVKIRVLTEGLPEELRDKAFIGRIGATGNRSYVGGSMSQGWFEAEVRSFGNYAVMTDTIPPRINPLSIKDNNALTESDRIRFTISDNLAGIKSYEGTINGEWVLFEYDAKNRLLSYEIDKNRLETGKRHTLVLTVKDNVNNTATYEATFWK
jgi:hypothetical protein